MPKDTSKDPNTSGNKASSKEGGFLNVLKRNQACHQCRKRKLKCDAKRPCSTCVRSHTHAVSHAPAGTELPPHPECTFDDVAESPNVIAEGPKNRYERLENRINELETLLRQREQQSEGSSQSPPLSDSALQTSAVVSRNSNGDTNLFLPQSYPHGYTGPSPSIANTTGQFDQSPELFAHMNVVPNNESNTPSSHSGGYDIVWSTWPPNLPPPSLLRHLVELFFSFQPHATRLFHAPSFMASLSLPPTHTKFPIPPVLHAMCAVSTLYTAAVSSPPLPNYHEVTPIDEAMADEIFQNKHRTKEQRPDSFAEEQAKHARETIDRYLFKGEHLVPVLQANIMLTWYYWCHAKWVELFIGSGHSLRMLLPLGLNMCPPFHSISKTLRGPSIIPPARTVIEDEIRRNAFWMAYATDRASMFGNGWAHAIDDEDVAQLLPVRGDQFNQGVYVPPNERQWAHSKNVSLVHPTEQTDAFSLYIKGTMLISRVKDFNLRFRSKYYSGDPTCIVDTRASDIIDPRTTQAFKELDNIVLSFRSSFPAHLKNPLNGNILDPHLYCASLYPHICTILLHDPHADVRQSGCISALKILTAARATLDLIYAVWSTSYDITLIDLSCSICWLMSGRVLVRFLKAALEANSHDQVLTLRSELEFIQMAISKVGERLPLAYMHAKLLHDATAEVFGLFPHPEPSAPQPTLHKDPDPQVFIPSAMAQGDPLISW